MNTPQDPPPGAEQPQEGQSPAGEGEGQPPQSLPPAKVDLAGGLVSTVENSQAKVDLDSASDRRVMRRWAFGVLGAICVVYLISLLCFLVRMADDPPKWLEGREVPVAAAEAAPLAAKPAHGEKLAPASAPAAPVVPAKPTPPGLTEREGPNVHTVVFVTFVLLVFAAIPLSLAMSLVRIAAEPPPKPHDEIASGVTTPLIEFLKAIFEAGKAALRGGGHR